jgi:hypothetical protein
MQVDRSSDHAQLEGKMQAGKIKMIVKNVIPRGFLTLMALLLVLISLLSLPGCSKPSSETEDRFAIEDISDRAAPPEGSTDTVIENAPDRAVAPEGPTGEEEASNVSVLDGCVTLRALEGWEEGETPEGASLLSDDYLYLVYAPAGTVISYEGSEVPVILFGMSYADEAEDGAALIESMGAQYEKLYAQRPEDGHFEWDERDGIRGFYYNSSSADSYGYISLTYTTYLKTTTGKDRVIRCGVNVQATRYEGYKDRAMKLLESLRVHPETAAA